MAVARKGKRVLAVSAKSFMVDDFLLRMGRLDIGERLVNNMDVRNSWIFYSSACKPRWNDL